VPALAWISRAAIEPNKTYVVMASRVALTQYRTIPELLRFMLLSRIRACRSC
jgi:hypothetical protein